MDQNSSISVLYGYTSGLPFYVDVLYSFGHIRPITLCPSSSYIHVSLPKCDTLPCSFRFSLTSQAAKENTPLHLVSFWIVDSLFAGCLYRYRHDTKERGWRPPNRHCHHHPPSPVYVAMVSNFVLLYAWPPVLYVKD